MLTRFLALIISLALAGTVQAQERMRLAVTTSFHNSGLAEVLLPEISKDLGLEVQLLVVGTGQALKLGQAGDVDAVLVHSRAAEEAFVSAGHALRRTAFMYNDFVIIGPKLDPADIGSAQSALDALQRIAIGQNVFVSRGDDSGTHKKERSLWSAAQISPDGSWYRSVGSGMGAALNSASGMTAYILADRASWLNFGNKGELAVLFDGDPVLFNQYAYLPVNPDRHSHINAASAAKLENWLVSKRAQTLIDGYQIDGQALFVFNAKAP